MRRKGGWSVRALWPAAVMVVVLLVVLIANRGLPMEARPVMLDYLDSDRAALGRGEAASLLLVYDAGNEQEHPYYRTLVDALDAMDLSWRGVDAARLTAADLDGADVMLVCTQNLDPLAADIPNIVDWVDGGGHMALMMAPSGGALAAITRYLGIIEYAGGYLPYQSLRFVSSILPMWEGQRYEGGDLNDYTLAVRLEEDCTVYITTGDERALPLLWSRDSGKGRLAVFNTTLMRGRDARGYALMVLSALEDPLVWPVINAGMVFIDDFPAPQPEGTDQRLLDQYGYDIQGFFRNHWWPDMKRLTWEKNLRYTGVLIETYNDRVTGPFEPDTQDNALVRYYTSELLHSGGELGLHGYNHMPLCPQGFAYAGEDYQPWPSPENMALSLEELTRYARSFLPGASFLTYVPPSNYLSPQGQRALLETVGELRTISGLYLNEDGVNALVQEFCEEEDGVISVPRVTSGFDPDSYNRLVMAQELMLHGVFSHFIHPDDVLDIERGAGEGWAKLYESFCQTVERVNGQYPDLRWSTASEGAAAVQRYDRLHLRRQADEDGVTLTLTPFYDEAWVALKTGRQIQSVDGGTLCPVAEDFYWIKAHSGTVRVEWEARQ